MREARSTAGLAPDAQMDSGLTTVEFGQRVVDGEGRPRPQDAPSNMRLTTSNAGPRGRCHPRSACTSLQSFASEPSWREEHHVARFISESTRGRSSRR